MHCINFSFREMARDLAEIMEQLGHQRFMVAKACLMDILPNYHVWTNSTKSWAIGTWHWGFMAQPEPFAERLISAALPLSTGSIQAHCGSSLFTS